MTRSTTLTGWIIAGCLCAPSVDLRAQASIAVAEQQAYLKASSTDPHDLFGWSLAMSGDTVVVGATGEDSGATGIDGNANDNGIDDSGAAWVYVRVGDTWSPQAYLKASNTDWFDAFGYSVAIDGDTIVVGADHEGSLSAGVDGNQADNGGAAVGAAYVFVRSGTTWSQQAYLKASNPGPFDLFGRSVAISGDTIVVGAPRESSNATGVNGNQTDDSATNAGAAYVFVRNGTTWSQQAYMKASNTDADDDFGSVVSICGDTVVVGAVGEDSSAVGVNGNQADDSLIVSGAAYVFVRSGGIWSQQAYLKASNPDSLDGFGTSVSISGETLIIGAGGEDSAATGVNGNESDNGSYAAGAAYVFVRNGTTWSQQAYLKASNAGYSDGFGHGVSVRGDWALVGATAEDSKAKGVDGDQLDDSLSGAGAAYLFEREGSTWSQIAYLKSSNPDLGDTFGFKPTLSGGSLVVAAIGEDSHVTGVDGDQASNFYNEAGAAYVFGISPFTDLGHALPGSNGLPTLEGTGTLTPGSTTVLSLTSAASSASSALVIGLQEANLPFLGGTLVPSPGVIVVGISTGVTGSWILAGTWPSGVPVGTEFYFQAWIADGTAPQGMSASNGLRATSP